MVETDLSKLEQILGYTFNNKKGLSKALTHKSASAAEIYSNYEVYEFLGDAVLDLVVSSMLIEKYPGATEGELSKMRASIVSTSGLAKVCLQLGIDKFILYGKANEGKIQKSILADVTESVIAAIFLDGGYDKTFSVVSNIFKDEVVNVDPSDPKTELQELLHIMKKDPPEYQIEYNIGPPHDPIFKAIVLVDGEVYGSGKGSSKKSAHQKAAKEAINKLNKGNNE